VVCLVSLVLRRPQRFIADIEPGSIGSILSRMLITRCCRTNLPEKFFLALVPTLFLMELAMALRLIKLVQACVELPLAPLLLQVNSILPA
jgi:hypothetical protein